MWELSDLQQTCENRLEEPQLDQIVVVDKIVIVIVIVVVVVPDISQFPNVLIRPWVDFLTNQTNTHDDDEVRVRGVVGVGDGGASKCPSRSTAMVVCS